MAGRRSQQLEEEIRKIKEDMERIRQGRRKKVPRVTWPEAEDEFLRRLKYQKVDFNATRKKRRWGLV